MDFSALFKLRTRRSLWMDVVFYFVISLLVATVLCYIIFFIKDVIQKQQISQEDAKLQSIGSDDQKNQEKEVILYQKKIADFATLLKNHEFASNVFSFMQQNTRLNIWFSSFGLDAKNAVVNLSGEAEDTNSLSRQVADLEKSEYVKSVNVLNSTLGQSSKMQFNINLSLNAKIFSYIADMAPILETTSLTAGEVVQTNPGEQKSSDKFITVFDFSQPQAVGILNETQFTVTLSVPTGTDISNLSPSIIVSPKATVSPQSGKPQDFTNPVVYTVTAEDGTIQSYTVTVNVLPQPVAKSNKSALTAILITIISLVLIAGGGLAAYFVYKEKLKKKSQL